ncbi:MAG: PAS domain-containing protein, partial [Syntrophales bacterium]|nr:PAS domain-containing protein [Syntrophales bacterium]
MKTDETNNYRLSIAALEQELAACREELQSLRESERKYRHLFEHSPVMVYLSNLDGVILDINAAGVRLLGYESREEIVGKVTARSLYTDQQNRLRFVETIAERGSVEAFETQLHRRDGSVIDVRITSSVRLNDQGEIEGYE